LIFCSVDVGIICAAKEDHEVNSMRKAARLTTEIFKEVYKSNLMETIDADKKIRHVKMSALIEDSLKDQRKLLGIDPQHVEPCFTPIIQSGGNYK
jgi:nucleosome binding factor SPN SPT16 subunit